MQDHYIQIWIETIAWLWTLIQELQPPFGEKDFVKKGYESLLGDLVIDLHSH